MNKIINLDFEKNPKIAKYKNGNYYVTLFKDGTKIRENNLDFFEPEFPESVDITISKKCNEGCHYCYMDCTANGRVANLEGIDDFLDTFHPYTELALNGNDVNDPTLIDFLRKANARNLICNLTVNQNHFIDNYDKIINLMDIGLIHGLGISVKAVGGLFLDLIKHPNIVLHTIVGLLNVPTLEMLANRNVKLLLLGYKNKGRGEEYNHVHMEAIRKRTEEIKNCIESYIDKFKVVSFDNLALEQLHVKEWLKDWDKIYMGDEGQYTFYIDLVDMQYYVSSTEKNGFKFTYQDSVKDMFMKIRNLGKAENAA